MLLFGDGCAAALVTAEAEGVALEDFLSFALPESDGMITWDIGDTGFDMQLSGHVPQRIQKAMADERARNAPDGVLRGRQPEELTAEEAYQLLADKRAKGPATRGDDGAGDIDRGLLGAAGLQFRDHLQQGEVLGKAHGVLIAQAGARRSRGRVRGPRGGDSDPTARVEAGARRSPPGARASPPLSARRAVEAGVCARRDACAAAVSRTCRRRSRRRWGW
jgi:hypothetical protein